MEFILGLGFCVMILMLFRLRERVSQLEWHIKLLEKNKSAEAAVSALEVSASFSPVNQSATAWPQDVQPLSDHFVSVPPVSVFIPQVPVATTASLQPAIASEFFLYTWFKDQTLIKVGALIFFLGAVWFVSYAISQGWVPVSVRILIGFVMALLIYAVGVWRQTIEEEQYVILTALGTAIVLVTVFCAQFLYDLFPAIIALGFIIASIGYTTVVAIQSKTEWLAVAGAAAGLSAPFLIGVATPDPLPFMLYLLALATCFSCVVFFTKWRLVSLVLVGGVSFFEILGIHHMNDGLLWFFMILFAGLFLVSTTVSLYRSAAPEPADIVLLGIVGCVYTVGAHTLAFMPGLALFVAAFLLAGIGYTLAGMNAPKRVIAVYVCFASAAWLIGTSFLLSGFSELLALTIEITLAFFVLTELRLSARAINLSTATFLLPLIASLPVLFSPVWQTGLFHLEALSVVVVSLAFIGAVVWVIERPELRRESWARPVTTMLGAGGFLYTLIVLGKIAQSGVGAGNVFTYVLWSGFIFSCLYYALSRRLSDTWVTTFFASIMLPLAASMYSLTLHAWQKSVIHPGAIGVYSMLAFLVLITLVLYSFYRETQSAYYKMLVVIGSGISLAYSFLVIAVFWASLFQPNISVVLIYGSYALILYALLTLCWHMRNPLPSVYVVTIIGVIPLVLSLQSLDIQRWNGSVADPHAAGLYVMTVLAVISAMRFLTYRTDDVAALARTRRFGTVLCITAGLYSLAIVWLITHVVCGSSSLAVMIALFIYTLAGLGLYVRGKSRSNATIKYAGMALLAVVVIRLGVVEVWSMDILWRIVTFLGIGFLFMLAALLEKKK